MNHASISTDESLHSSVKYGTEDFPFSCYTDLFTQQNCQCIEWHWHSEFEFSYVKEGSVRCRTGSASITLQKGEGIFLNSGLIHRFEGTSDSILINYIFSPVFIAEKSSLIYTKYIQPFLISDFEYCPFFKNNLQHQTILKDMTKLYPVCGKKSFNRELQIHILLSSLWLHFFEMILPDLHPAAKSGTKVMQARLHQMLHYIQEHYFFNLSLVDIASSANISKSEALRCFHTILDTTPVNYLNEYRLTRAVRLLTDSSDPISLIAEKCGFQSSGYFCKVFKGKFHLSPVAFRKSIML